MKEYTDIINDLMEKNKKLEQENIEFKEKLENAREGMEKILQKINEEYYVSSTNQQTKLFKLEPMPGLPKDSSNPFYPAKELVYRLIVRAENEAEARSIAALWDFRSHAETHELYNNNVWADTEKVMCSVVEEQGDKEILIADFRVEEWV